MTLSRTKIHIACGLLCLSALASAAEPLDGRLLAAQSAVTRAEALPMGGNAIEMLAEARRLLALAQDAATARKTRDAIQHASGAEAAADLAVARYRYNLLRFEIEGKTSRNTQLRRRLLVAPGGAPR